jgi:hypothetical protein
VTTTFLSVAAAIRLLYCIAKTFPTGLSKPAHLVSTYHNTTDFAAATLIS